MFAAASKVSAVVAPRAASLRRASPQSTRAPLAPQTRRSTTASAGKDEDLMEQLLAMLGGGAKGGIVAESDALPGRQEEMRVTDQHFVLGNSIKTFPDNLETCVFATGCFWGTEKMFWRVPGVFSTSVGYVGGFTQNPTYEETCSGRTGHTEAVQVAWDPSVVSFADLLAMHWTCHDPTQGNRQGNDSGTQYRSGIYCSSATQKEMALASAEVYSKSLQKAGHPRSAITSEINGPGDNCVYYFAEDYHQQYLAKPGARPYCSAQPTGVPVPADWLSENGAKLPAAYWARYGPKPGCTIQVSNEPVPVEEALKA